MKNWDRHTATKETADRLRQMLLDAVPIELQVIKEDLLAFLNACSARLPTMATVDRNATRRGKGKGTKPAGGTSES